MKMSDDCTLWPFYNVEQYWIRVWFMLKIIWFLRKLSSCSLIQIIFLNIIQYIIPSERYAIKPIYWPHLLCIIIFNKASFVFLLFTSKILIKLIEPTLKTYKSFETWNLHCYTMQFRIGNEQISAPAFRYPFPPHNGRYNGRVEPAIPMSARRQNWQSFLIYLATIGPLEGPTTNRNRTERSPMG